MKTILLTGWTGFIGRAVLRQVCENLDGTEQIILASRFGGAQRDVGGVRSAEHVTLDLAKPIALSVPVDVVIHMAGEKRDQLMMEAVNVSGTRKLLDWALSNGCRRFVHLSTAGVYGAGVSEEVITEASPKHPQNEYERTKRLAEEIVTERCRTAGIEYCMLEPTNVFGESPSAPLLGLVRVVARGYVAMFGRTDGWLNYVPVEDVASAVLHVTRSKRAGDTYILNSPVRVGAAVAAIAAALDVASLRVIRIPKRLGSIATAAAERFRGWGWPTLPLDRGRFEELTRQTRFDGSRITRQEGFVYPLGTAQRIGELARRYRERGLL